MGIRFEKEEKRVRFLNPFQGFQESEARCEIRRDPLTGRTGRLAHFVGFKLPSCDLSSIIEETRQKCPFCPERVLDKTPMFPPDIIEEGRLQRGETTLFPNLFPYDRYNAVAVFTREHYLPLGDFSAGQIMDGFLCCLDYFRRLPVDHQDRFALIHWNYMPAAASSQIHSHFQTYLTEAPGNFLSSMLAASLEYSRRYNKPYWEDLLSEESRLDERFISKGEHCFWMTDFVSLSPLSDVLAVFPGKQTLFELSDEALEECCQGLIRVFRHLEQCGVYSLNMGWLPGLKNREDYWLQLRITPRLYLAPKVWCTDAPALTVLYGESFMFWKPEDVAQSMRGAFPAL